VRKEDQEQRKTKKEEMIVQSVSMNGSVDQLGPAASRIGASVLDMAGLSHY